MRSDNPEYILYRHLAYYIRAQYPGFIFHYDPTGLNLSKAQCGMLKAIQGFRGFPDLAILEPHGIYHGLFIELKSEGTKLYNKFGLPVTTHIGEQLDCLIELRIRGYKAEFACGFDETKKLIDRYLNNKL